jgi:molecular chaperone IbpA
MDKQMTTPFDTVLVELDRLYSYPQHNVIKLDETSTLIELALAGFSDADINIQLKDNILTISGNTNSVYDDAAYVYKGISTKQFSKSFTLSEGTEVISATSLDGILNVNLSSKTTQEKLGKVIPINADKQPIVVSKTKQRSLQDV